MKKKIISLCLVAALALCVMVGGTVAYLTDTEKAENVMTIGEVNINLEERMKNADGQLVPFVNNTVPMVPMSDSDGIVSYNKVVDVYNDGNTDAYIRTIVAIQSFTPTGYEAEDKVVVFGTSWSSQVVEGKHITEITIGEDNYTVLVLDQADKDPVKPNEKIQSLQSIWLKSTVTGEMLDVLGGDLDVMVLAQGVQAAGFDSYEAAMNSFGEVNSENLTKWFSEANSATINDK